MELTINGEQYSFELKDETTPLLWVLRDFLDLTGTKYSCGIGQCGACTVHVDGKSTRSCSIPALSLEGKEITTIEGADSNTILRALQDNWVTVDVPQCGYCQSGQLMSAAALLSHNKFPSSEDINEAMHGNICRCGTYVRIKKAIEKTAEELNS